MLQLILLTAILYLRGLRPGFSQAASVISKVIYRCLVCLLVLHIAEAIFSFFYFGKYYTPELPDILFWFHVILNGCLVFGTGVILFRDAINFVFLFVVRRFKIHIPIRDWGKTPSCAFGTLVTACLLAIYAYHEALQPPIVRHITLPVAGLPKAFSGLTIVQLSDLHVYRLTRGTDLQHLVQRVNAIKPDFVVLTGDIADGSLVHRRNDLYPLKRLKAIFGILGCEGNHEHYMDYTQYSAFYSELGIRWLRNTHVVLRKGSEELVIVGLTDNIAEDFNRELPNLEKALQGAPAAPIILLSHQPSDVRVYASHPNIKLMLSGHTHGGQIIGPSVYAQLRSNGYLSGLYQIPANTADKAPLWLYVSPGSYFFPSFPFRIGTRNEITCFTLQRQ